MATDGTQYTVEARRGTEPPAYLGNVVKDGVIWPFVTIDKSLATKYPTVEAARAEWNRLPEKTKALYRAEVHEVHKAAPERPRGWQPDPTHSHGKRVAWVREDGVGLTFERTPPTRADKGELRRFRPAFLQIFVWSPTRGVRGFVHVWPDTAIYHAVGEGRSPVTVSGTDVVRHHALVEACVEGLADEDDIAQVTMWLTRFGDRELLKGA